MLDRETFLVIGEDELRHRLTYKILPSRFRHIWTGDEVGKLKIPNVWIVPVPRRFDSKIFTEMKEAVPVKKPGRIDAYFTLEPIEILKRKHYLFWMQNLKDVQDAINGN